MLRNIVASAVPREQIKPTDEPTPNSLQVDLADDVVGAYGWDGTPETYLPSVPVLIDWTAESPDSNFLDFREIAHMPAGAYQVVSTDLGTRPDPHNPSEQIGIIEEHGTYDHDLGTYRPPMAGSKILNIFQVHAPAADTLPPDFEAQ
jgi:hypothetical protein